MPRDSGIPSDWLKNVQALPGWLERLTPTVLFSYLLCHQMTD